MNNNFIIINADTEPAAQQSHGNWEDKVACMQFCILGKHEYWYRKHNKTLLDLFGILEYVATGQNNTPQGAGDGVRSGWHRYFYVH